MSNLKGKLEHLQEIKSSAVSVMDYLGSKKYNLQGICSNKISSLEVVEGNWGVKNTVLLGRYLLDGKEVISKEVLENIDEKNRIITYSITDGDIMKFYKTIKVIFEFQVVSSSSSDGDDNHEKNYMKFTYEYEKVNPEIPPPKQFKDFVAEIIKMIDEYLSSSSASM